MYSETNITREKQRNIIIGSVIYLINVFLIFIISVSGIVIVTTYMVDQVGAFVTTLFTMMVLMFVTKYFFWQCILNLATENTPKNALNGLLFAYKEFYHCTQKDFLFIRWVLTGKDYLKD